MSNKNRHLARQPAAQPLTETSTLPAGTDVVDAMLLAQENLGAPGEGAGADTTPGAEGDDTTPGADGAGADTPPAPGPKAGDEVRVVAVHGDMHHQLTGVKFTQTEETLAVLDSFIEVQVAAGKLRLVTD